MFVETSGAGSGFVGDAAFAGGMGAEDAFEKSVDVAKLALEVEGVGQFVWGEEAGDALVVGDALAEAGLALPGFHGVLLDGFVGVVAGHALLDEILEELAGEDEALGELEIAEHALGEDAHLGEERGHFGKHVVHEDGGVGKDDALDATVGDVALVPEGDVFVGGDHVGADKASEAANLLAGDGIALVGHGGAAALLVAEVLLGFADLGALEVANFEGDFFEERGDERKGAEIVGVAVALNDLRGDGSDLETEAGADAGFDVGTEMGGVADGAGDFAEVDAGSGFAEAGDVALIFGEPVGDLEAEGDGLGMDAVGAADLGRVLEFVGADVEDFAEEDEVALDEARGVAEEEGLSGVDDVVGGHAVVKPAGSFGIGDGFADGHGEGDDVVLDASFEVVDAGDVDLGARADEIDGFGGNLAGFGKSLGGGEFDVEPALEAVGVAPDMAHVVAGIARNHVGVSQKEYLP